MPRSEHPQRLRFDRFRYGNEILIDAVDQSNFDVSIVHAEVDFYAVAAFKSAEGSMRINQRSVPIRPNTLLFLAPGAQAINNGLNMDDTIWLFFDGLFVDSFFGDAFFTLRFDFFHGPDALLPLHLDETDFDSAYALMNEIAAERQNMRNDSEHMLRSALYLLLIRLNRLYSANHNTRGEIITDRKLLALKQLLETRIAEVQTVQQAAELLGVSRTYLNALCKRRFGRTCQEIIHDRIVLAAKHELVFSTQSAAEIGYSLGFSDPSNFNRFFKRMTGATPLEFRDQFSK